MGGARFALVLLLQLLCDCQKLEWTASNFPNPTANEYKRCKMRSSAQICDPDEMLSQKDRYRLNHELHQLESRTRQNSATDFCQKKGITAAMAIMKHAGDGSEQAIKDLANQILKRWTLDEQCQKSVVFVVATDDHRFWVARDPKVPVYGSELNQIFNDQKQLFKAGNYQEALGNAVKETWQMAVSKQSADGGPVPADSGDDGPRRVKPIAPADPKEDYGDKGRGGGGAGGGGIGSIISKLPFWFWIALVLIVIPILFCCCICYCCFCRKGGDSSPRRQEPSDVAGDDGHLGGGGGGGGGGRSRGGGLNGFLGGLGGAGVGQLLGSLLSGRGGRGGGGGGGGGSGFRRGEPDQGQARFSAGLRDGDKELGGGGGGGGGGAATGGKGFYPAVPVNDQGGGGGW